MSMLAIGQERSFSILEHAVLAHKHYLFTVKGDSTRWLTVKYMVPLLPGGFDSLSELTGQAVPFVVKLVAPIRNSFRAQPPFRYAYDFRHANFILLARSTRQQDAYEKKSSGDSGVH